MIWNFNIVYASGRKEPLCRGSNNKAKELHNDLSKALEIGSVPSFEEDTCNNKNDLRTGKKRASTVHLKPGTKDITYPSGKQVTL